MSTLVISPSIKGLLDAVIESGIEQQEALAVAHAKQREHKSAQNQMSDFLHEEASKSDEVADYFFSEAGVLYRGKLFQFDDEGALIVSDGPTLVECEPCNTQQ
ncbi:hypothetical protein [Nitrincola sp.]|uniref:hypothetical protein n=1 Tax=Nitrincola sp. TaxID=1926584 RepID=UPI003A8FCF9F